jgi:hypothetical protein
MKGVFESRRSAPVAPFLPMDRKYHTLGIPNDEPAQNDNVPGLNPPMGFLPSPNPPQLSRLQGSKPTGDRMQTI